MIAPRRPDQSGGPESERQHVLFATRWYPSYDSPGRGSFVADQAAALVAAGLDVTVASWEPVIFRDTYAQAPLSPTTVDPWLEAIEGSGSPASPHMRGAPGVPVIRLPGVVAARSSSDVLANAAHEAHGLLRIGARLDADRPIDIVHAHTGAPDGIAALALADRLRVPLVVTEHDSSLVARLGDPAVRAAYGRLLGPGRRLVAVSNSLAQSIAGGLRVDVAALSVIPNVVDVAAFHPTAAADRDPAELLWVGAVKASKGIVLLLEAFRELHSEMPDLRLRLIGSTPTPAELAGFRGIAAEMGIAAAVRFEPAVDRASVAAAMERAAVLVHPSPYETFGIVAAEALASGLPVASTPSGGVPEIIGADMAFGAVAAAHDAVNLAAAVRDVLARRTSFDPQAMRRSVVERYAPEVVAQRLLRVYGDAQADLDREPGKKRSRAHPLGEGTANAAPEAPLASGLPILVGLLRSASIERVAAIPPALAGALVLVTGVEHAPTGGVAAVRPTPALSSVPLIEVDVEQDYRRARSNAGGDPPRGRVRRALWVARNPIRAMRIRRLGARRSEMLLQTARSALRGILQPGIDGGRVVEILPLSLDDLVAVMPLLSEHVGLYPTTLRGLVDHWDAADRPSLPPGSALAAGRVFRRDGRRA